MLVGALGFAVVPPPPKIDPTVGPRKSLDETRKALAKASEDARHGRDRMVDRTWGLEAERLGVQVMGTVGRVAEGRHIEVSNFTTGRTIESAGLRQVPFAVTLAGAFPDVLAAMADLERPTSKLAIAA